MFAAVDGLDNLPMNADGAAALPELALRTLAAQVDANGSGILSLDATLATGALSATQIAGYRALFRQAAAQGMTTLVSRTAMSTGFPGEPFGVDRR